MSKNLAICGHATRGKEVIELLTMMGGTNPFSINDGSVIGNKVTNCYYISKDTATKYISWDYVGPEEIQKYKIFTLEEFLEKYPFKVGDKVIDVADGCPGVVSEMKWDADVSDMKYCVVFGNGIDFGWFANDSIEFCKENENLEETPVRNRDDILFDSTIWHLRNSVNNGKQYLSGGECEDYFREIVKKNNENKMSDCKKCGLVFGSVSCFDKDCPHNKPKSYVVSLIGNKVIDNLICKDIDMHTNACKDTARDARKKIAYLSIDNEDYADQIEINLGDNYEYKFEMNRLYILKKKPKYPKTYKGCCDVLGVAPYYNLKYHTYEPCYDEYTTMPELCSLQDKLNTLGKLIICQSAYWKVAGEEMGLGKRWKPDWKNTEKVKYGITFYDDAITKVYLRNENKILVFPAEEIRDAFYENFKELIEECKELL